MSLALRDMKSRQGLNKGPNKKNKKKEQSSVVIEEIVEDGTLQRKEAEKVIADELIRKTVDREIAVKEAKKEEKTERKKNRLTAMMRKMDEAVESMGWDPCIELSVYTDNSSTSTHVPIEVERLWLLFCPFFQLADFIKPLGFTDASCFWATFIDFMRLSFQGDQMPNVTYVPRELAIISRAVFPKKSGGINYNFVLEPTGTWSSSWDLTFANFCRTYGDNPAANVVPAAIAQLTSNYTVNYELFEQIWKDRAAVFNLVRLTDVKEDPTDCSAYAATMLTLVTTTVGNRYNVPGLYRKINSTTGYFKVCHTQPGLEVPIKTRWLASLALRVITDARYTQGYLVHHVECEHPSIEIGHQLYCSLYGAPKTARNAVPKTVPFLIEDLIRCGMSYLDIAQNTKDSGSQQTTKAQKLATIFWTVICRWFSPWSFMFPPQCGYAVEGFAENLSSYSNTVNKTDTSPPIPALLTVALSMIHPFFRQMKNKTKGKKKGPKEWNFMYYPLLVIQDETTTDIAVASNYYSVNNCTWAGIANDAVGQNGFTTVYSGGIAFGTYPMAYASNATYVADTQQLARYIEYRQFPETFHPINIAQVVRVNDGSSIAQVFHMSCAKLGDPCLKAIEYFPCGSMPYGTGNNWFSKAFYWLRFTKTKKSTESVGWFEKMKMIAASALIYNGVPESAPGYNYIHAYDTGLQIKYQSGHSKTSPEEGPGLIATSSDLMVKSYVGSKLMEGFVSAVWSTYQLYRSFADPAAWNYIFGAQ